jgi:hypothetical protein
MVGTRDADDGGPGESADPGNPSESSTAARRSVEGLRYSYSRHSYRLDFSARRVLAQSSPQQ